MNLKDALIKLRPHLPVSTPLTNDYYYALRRSDIVYTQFQMLPSFPRRFILINIALNVWQPRVNMRTRERMGYAMHSAK